MNAWIDAKEWEVALLGWGVRGTLVALPSWGLALLAGFDRPPALLAMLTGTTLWVLVFATACSLQIVLATEPRRRWIQALKWAAWLKLAWMVLSLPLMWVLGSLVERGIAPWFFGGAFADFLTGMLITEGLGQDNGLKGYRTEALNPSFGWTLVYTLLQGAAIAVGLILIACALRGLAWLNDRYRILRRLFWVST